MPDAGVCSANRTRFINAKYRDKRFCCLHEQSGNQSALNEVWYIVSCCGVQTFCLHFDNGIISLFDSSVYWPIQTTSMG